MGKWGKYDKVYNAKWEKDPRLKAWISRTPEEEVNKGKPKAYCKVCDTTLRAHYNDLISHGETSKHRGNMERFNKKTQRTLHDYGTSVVTDNAKLCELKLAVFIAAHCAVTSIDHLGGILKELGKGSSLENIRVHRTKCSKLISNVIAPAFLSDLLKDIGDAPYSLIVDEVTDCSVSKFMGVCVRFYDRKKGKMVTDFLGLIQVTGCTGKELSDALKEYLAKIGLPLKNLRAIGVDGAPNMCGHINSFYTHLKQDVPDLLLFKCICHSVDKCAEHAFGCMPEGVTDLLNETTNYFAHSAKRWDEYVQYYKTMHEGREPKKLTPLSRTRWLVWLPASDVVFDQWYELKGFFAMKGSGPKGIKKAADLSLLYSSTNMLYITFLKTVLRGIAKMNKSFEQTDADITKLYTDLRSQVLVLAGRILKPECLLQSTRFGVLRNDEAIMLREALSKSENLLPVDRISLGDAFVKTAVAANVPPDELTAVRHKCGQYIFTLVKLLLDKLPTNLDAVSHLRFLTPRLALAKTARPTLQQLPLTLAGSKFRVDDLDAQWTELGTVTLEDLDISGDIDEVDIVEFWTQVLNLRNAGGDKPFEHLALFALAALTLPISNAVVERAFSCMSCIKVRRRNGLQLHMLESLMRLRIHMKVDGLCCRDFKPSKEMLRLFTADMYRKHHEPFRAEPPLFVDDENPDDPASIEMRQEVQEQLADVDYEVISMIDATHFNENLFVVNIFNED